MQVICGALGAMGVIDGPASFRQLRAAVCRAKTPAWALTWRFALASLLCDIR